MDAGGRVTPGAVTEGRVRGLRFIIIREPTVRTSTNKPTRLTALQKRKTS
jgi:hypothetical protein